MSNVSAQEENSKDEEVSNELNHKKGIQKNKGKKKKIDKMISSTFRTKKCEFYNRGSCKKGSECPFSHRFVPEVSKVQISLFRKFVSSS